MNRFTRGEGKLKLLHVKGGQFKWTCVTQL